MWSCLVSGWDMGRGGAWEEGGVWEGGGAWEGEWHGRGWGMGGEHERGWELWEYPYGPPHKNQYPLPLFPSITQKN